MRNQKDHLQISILDRLIDNEPTVTVENVESRAFSFREIKNSVIRDIENLLNSRRNILPAPASYNELNKSLFVYGLPDFTSENPNNPFVKQKLRKEIQKVISLFEPRLKKISVQFDQGTNNIRNIRFRISGILVVDPISEPVVFDTKLDPVKGEYLIAR